MNPKTNFLLALIGLAFVLISSHLHGAIGVIVLAIGVLAVGVGAVMQLITVLASHPPQEPPDKTD